MKGETIAVEFFETMERACDELNRLYESNRELQKELNDLKIEQENDGK